MTTAINRTTYEYFAGVSDTLPTGVWLLNPDLTSVSGVEQKYWKVEGDSVLEMTDTEKNIKDMHIAAIQATPPPDVVSISGIIHIDGDRDEHGNSIISVVPRKPYGDVYNRIYSFSINICDPTTWYVDSEYIDNQLLGVASGQQDFYTTHGSGHGCAIIDLCHGKITEENLLVAPTGSYRIQVTVDGILQTERECYEYCGGDYEVDYLAGKIHFFTPPSSGEVRASYFHAPSGVGPIFSVMPPAGKKWVIDSAELQVSDDFVMNDTIVQNVFLTHPVEGRIKTIPDVEYKHFANILDFTYGSYPVVPVVGSGPRAMSSPTIIMRWEYLTPLELLSSLEMELRSWAKHGREFGGERFCLTVYGLETDE